MSRKFAVLVVANVICYLTVLIFRTSSQAISCVEHSDCLLNQYCERATTYTCRPCRDCSPYWRYNGYSSCVQNILSDCGPCQDGYHEVEHYLSEDRAETCAPNEAVKLQTTAFTVIIIFVTFIIFDFIFSYT